MSIDAISRYPRSAINFLGAVARRYTELRKFYIAAIMCVRPAALLCIGRASNLPTSFGGVWQNKNLQLAKIETLILDINRSSVTRLHGLQFDFPPYTKGSNPSANMIIHAVAHVLGNGLAYQPNGIK